jgi:DNA-binding NarL/FixJ family response regulator
MIHLFLVDDQAPIRRSMKVLLNCEPDLQVVGEAENGQAAIASIETLFTHQSPLDLVLMDVRMPVMDGIAATEILGQQFPTLKVLVLTTFDDEVYVRQSLQAGAAGYLLKDTPFDELTQAIRSIDKGYTQLAPGLVQKIMSNSPTPVSETKTLPAEWQDLTPRELEILQCIARGASNREIAQELFIAEKTVRNHVTSILSRLNLRDRTQAAISAHAYFSGIQDSQWKG